MDEWMDSLRRADGALRPEAGALAEISTEVRRRRKRRAGVTALAAAASVAVVVGGGALAVGGDGPADRDATDRSGDATPAAPTPATRSADPASFTCPTESPVFDSDAAPVLDNDTAQVYKKTYSEIAHREFEGFSLHRIEIFHAGVFVLVTGDGEKARRTLTPYGVAGVGLWDPDGPASGMDEYAQLEQLIHWRLGPVLQHAKQAVARLGEEGFATFAVWVDADAILVQWKDPVPTRVRALEDTRFMSGAEIIVQGVRYSRADIDLAQLRRLPEWLANAGRREHWSSTRACGDFSGLVVGMTPGFLEETDRGALQTELADAVGMPVMVVAEDRPVELGAGG